ncbi:MAG: penicillin-binding transpeptidase domain-containing protein [Weeksellaceae bacterium]
MNTKLPFIEKGHTGSMKFNRQSTVSSRGVVVFYALGIFIFLGLLIVRLFHLTIVKGNYYAKLADNNRVKEILIEPKRGTITDRKGLVIAENSTPNLDQQDERVLSKRLYNFGQSMSHIIGYRQTASAEDLAEDPCVNKLRLGAKTGKKGVEQLYECDLRGVSGKKLMEVDAHGVEVRTLGVLPPQDGKDIQLAVDAVLQQQAYDLLKGQKGAVVGLKPQTGEVLVLASAPGFDPQVFEDADTKTTATYIEDKEEPLFNRATEGVYPPGSTFKLFVAAAGLEEKVVTPESTIEDKGVLKAGPLEFHNWYFLEYGKTDGIVDIYKSLQRSNDIYYYELGGKLGPEKIRKWAEYFGFQNKSRIGLPESVGIIPSSFWKQDVLKEQWYLGDTYNLSIGQGYVTSTPLQVAVGTAAFANGGKICKPQLQKNGSDPNAKPECEKVPMKESTYTVIREGMRQACAAGGTAYPFFDFTVNATPSASLSPTPTPEGATESAQLIGKKRIEVGCKTGTAESHGFQSNPHAWFTIFAPFDKPEIVLTVLVEKSGQGSDVAAPIAHDILKTYFEREE